MKIFPKLHYEHNITVIKTRQGNIFKKGEFENFWLVILMNVDANILKKYQQIKSCNIEV